MDKRLKITAIIMGVVFVAIFTKNVIEFMQGFRTGFAEGFEAGRSGETLSLIDILLLTLVFYALFLVVMIPVHVFRVIRSITKNSFFEFENVKRLRKVGYAILVLCVAVVLFAVRDGEQLLQASLDSLLLLLFGFVVLTFAEVLKVSVRLKEEQDLNV